jgi:hypothetical protein
VKKVSKKNNGKVIGGPRAMLSGPSGVHWSHHESQPGALEP